MAVLPKEFLLQKELIKELIQELQFQPAGVDLTISKVFSFKSPGVLDFDNSKRELSLAKEIEFVNEKVFLPQGAYKVRFNEIVSIPLDMMALFFPRSSLLRCGASLDGAVWDPGYEGRGESLLIIHNPHGLTLYKNARIAQLVFIKLLQPTQEGYGGTYQGENVRGNL